MKKTHRAKLDSRGFFGIGELPELVRGFENQEVNVTIETVEPPPRCHLPGCVHGVHWNIVPVSNNIPAWISCSEHIARALLDIGQECYIERLTTELEEYSGVVIKELTRAGYGIAVPEPLQGKRVAWTMREDSG